MKYIRVAILLLFILSLSLSACSIHNSDMDTVSSLPISHSSTTTATTTVPSDPWNVMSYLGLEDIISISKVDDECESVETWCVRYQSDDCNVVSYLSIPEKCLSDRVPYSCVIFNRGGNQNLGYNTAQQIAGTAEMLNSVVFASDYRGTLSSSGQDEFGGNDLHDVLKLIDFCEYFPFVDMDRLYMWGVSRGGMMTYMSIRQDDRIDKAIVVSGTSNLFTGYNYREDMRENVLKRLIGGSPDELPEEYKKRSAVFWAEEFKCPVLFFHSKQDPRVSYDEAAELVKALDAAGKEYKFVSYDDDVHGLHPEDGQIIMEWCDFGPKIEN